MKILKGIALILLFLLPAEGECSEISVEGGLSREMALAPGQGMEGILYIGNHDKERPCEVRLYQTDYSFRADGSTLYGDPGGLPRSNAAWIKITPARLVIPPGGTAGASYRIKVPDSPRLSGTYWSLVMVEPVTEDAAAGSSEKVRVGIRAVMRYAVQMITDINDTGAVGLAFTDKRLAAPEGKKLLQVDMENTGERWLSPVAWADVFSATGAHAGRFGSTRKRVFPGCSIRHEMDLGALAAGIYNVLVVADCGADNVFGARYELEIK